MERIILIFSLIGCSFGNPCELDIDCSETLGLRNTICVNNVCECHPDFYLDSQTGHCSLSNHRIYGGCSVDKDCAKFIPNSICNLGQCMCESGFETNFRLRTCEQVIGAPCSTPLDCKSAVFNVGCDLETKTCQCPKGYFYSNGMEYYTPSCNEITTDVGIGKDWYYCLTDEHCASIKNSYCDHWYNTKLHGYCDCKVGYLRSKDRKICIKIEDVECSSNSDCQFHNDDTQCENNKCRCRDGYFFNSPSQSCEQIPVVLRSGYCKDDSHCTQFENSECRYNTFHHRNQCFCKAGYVDRVRTCLEALGSDCAEDSECAALEHSMICKDKKCNCKDGYFFTLGGFCNRKPDDIGSYCSTDQQCHEFEQNSFCNSNVCECHEGYVRTTVDGRRLCRMALGDCETSKDCTGEHQRCLSNKEQTLKYCGCEYTHALGRNSSTEPYECQHPIWKDCGGSLDPPASFCASHLKNSYCKSGFFINRICTCDDINGYFYDTETKTCKKLI